MPASHRHKLTGPSNTHALVHLLQARLREVKLLAGGHTAEKRWNLRPVVPNVHPGCRIYLKNQRTLGKWPSEICAVERGGAQWARCHSQSFSRAVLGAGEVLAGRMLSLAEPLCEPPELREAKSCKCGGGDRGRRTLGTGTGQTPLCHFAASSMPAPSQACGQQYPISMGLLDTQPAAWHTLIPCAPHLANIKHLLFVGLSPTTGAWC